MVFVSVPNLYCTERWIQDKSKHRPFVQIYPYLRSPAAATLFKSWDSILSRDLLAAHR